MLDLHPWGDCDENALVEDYVRTNPGRSTGKRRNRKKCPISASNLFNKGGPEITGDKNMQIIHAFEKSNAEVVAKKAEKKKKRTENRCAHACTLYTAY